MKTIDEQGLATLRDWIKDKFVPLAGGGKVSAIRYTLIANDNYGLTIKATSESGSVEHHNFLKLGYDNDNFHRILFRGTMTQMDGMVIYNDRKYALYSSENIQLGYSSLSSNYTYQTKFGISLKLSGNAPSETYNGLRLTLEGVNYNLNISKLVELGIITEE